jgi:hypothetical protein
VPRAPSAAAINKAATLGAAGGTAATPAAVPCEQLPEPSLLSEDLEQHWACPARGRQEEVCSARTASWVCSRQGGFVTAGGQAAEALGAAQPWGIFTGPILEYTHLITDPEPWLQQRDQQISEQSQRWGWPWRQELELRRHSRWLAAWQAFEQGEAKQALELWRRGCCHSQAPLAKQWLDALHLFSRCQEHQPAAVTVAELLREEVWKTEGCRLLGLRTTPWA